MIRRGSRLVVGRFGVVLFALVSGRGTADSRGVGWWAGGVGWARDLRHTETQASAQSYRLHPQSNNHPPVGQPWSLPGTDWASHPPANRLSTALSLSHSVGTADGVADLLTGISTPDLPYFTLHQGCF